MLHLQAALHNRTPGSQLKSQPPRAQPQALKGALNQLKSQPREGPTPDLGGQEGDLEVRSQDQAQASHEEKRVHGPDLNQRLDPANGCGHIAPNFCEHLYIYIYIYTSADPCIPCTENVRLCVECNMHPRSCPAKRLRVSSTCLVRFVFVRLCPVERPSEAERARAANSSRGRRIKVEPSKS